jgi:hypothetical protein
MIHALRQSRTWLVLTALTLLSLLGTPGWALSTHASQNCHMVQGAPAHATMPCCNPQALKAIAAVVGPPAEASPAEPSKPTCQCEAMSGSETAANVQAATTQNGPFPKVTTAQPVVAQQIAAPAVFVALQPLDECRCEAAPQTPPTSTEVASPTPFAPGLPVSSFHLLTTSPHAIQRVSEATFDLPPILFPRALPGRAPPTL